MEFLLLLIIVVFVVLTWFKVIRPFTSFGKQERDFKRDCNRRYKYS